MGITNNSTKSFERGVYELSSTSISFNVCFAPVDCLNRDRSNLNIRYKSDSHNFGSNHHRGSACARCRSNSSPERRLEEDGLRSWNSTATVGDDRLRRTLQIIKCGRRRICSYCPRSGRCGSNERPPKAKQFRQAVECSGER